MDTARDMKTDRKKKPVVPLDVVNTDGTREPTGENLRYNESEDSFELDPETADKEYRHPLPYNTAAPAGEDDKSSYDEENPYTPNEYRDKGSEMKDKLEELDTAISGGQLTQSDEVGEQLSDTTGDNHHPLDAEGYPVKDDAGGKHHPVLEMSDERRKDTHK